MSLSPLRSFLIRFEHIVIPAVYTLIALVMSYPLVAQFGDHIPGVEGDVWSYLWAMGWARTALLNLGVNPFQTDYIFYPLGGATQLLWGTALPSFASIPLQLAFGLVPAFNLMYLAATVLTAWGGYLVGKQVLTTESGQRTADNGPRPTEDGGRSNIHRSSFVIGLIFAFGSLRLGYGTAFTNLHHTEFIPFYVLFLLRATYKPGWKNAFLAGLFFALNVYVDFQIAAFLAVLTGFWFLYVLIGAGRRTMERASHARAALRVRDEGTSPYLRWAGMIAVAGILSLPMLVFVLQDFAVEGGNYIRVYPLRYSEQRAYDLLSYVLPNARSTLYQNLPFPRIAGVNAAVNLDGESELSPDRQAFLGITVLALAVLGAIRFRRKMLFWILATVAFAILSLGPVLYIAGVSTSIPMPFALANTIPILNHVRIPMRYGLMVLFGGSLLAGAGTLVLIQWRSWVFVPLSALIVLEAAVLPYPTLGFRVPAVYGEIARQEGDFSVLEIPSFNWRDAARNEAYQPIHQKRILRAYTNRIAPDLADYFNLRQTPIVVRSLRILEGEEEGVLTEGEIEQDRSMLADTLNFFNLRYAILHRDQLDTERAEMLDDYLRNVMRATVFYQDGEVTGYEFAVPPAERKTLELEMADNSNLMYLGRGWQTEPLADVDGEQGRYLKRDTAELYLPSRGTDGVQTTLGLWSENPGVTLEGSLNGQETVKNEVGAGWLASVFDFDAVHPLPQVNRLRLKINALPETIAIGWMRIKGGD